MDKSENLKDADKLYFKVRKALSKYRNATIPSRKEFYLHLKKFNALIEGHKSLLTAIGKL